MSGVFPSKEFVSMKQGNEFKVKKHLDQGILSRKFFRENLLRPRILTTFVAEELFEVMQKNASGRWISVTKSLPAYFLCSAYLLKLKKLKRTTLFYTSNSRYL